MREKLLEYAPPHPKAIWPLAANILDPVAPARPPTNLMRVSAFLSLLISPGKYRAIIIGLYHVCRQGSCEMLRNEAEGGAPC